MSGINLKFEEVLGATQQIIGSVSLLANQCLVMKSGLILVSQNCWSGTKCNRFLGIWNNVVAKMRQEISFFETELPNMINGVINKIAVFDGKPMEIPALPITELFQGLNEVDYTNQEILKITNKEELNNVLGNLKGMLEFIEGNFQHLADNMKILNDAIDLGDVDDNIMDTFETKFRSAKDLILNTRAEMCKELEEAINYAEICETGIESALASIFQGQTANA